MAEVSAIPRNPVWGLGADVLAKIRQMAEVASEAHLPGTIPVGEIVKMLVGNKPELLEDAAYGFPPTTGAGQATQIKPQYTGDVADVIPWGKAASAAKLMAGKLMAPEMAAGLGGLAGSLRVGGKPDLMLSHGGTLSRGRDLDLAPKELMHPSLAVTTENRPLNPFAGSYLIPRIGAFDPAYSTSTLFNRDAYLARAASYPGGWSPDPRQRMLTRGLLPPPKTEGTTTWVEPGKPDLAGDLGYRAASDWWKEPKAAGSHDAAIFASPAFRSFAEFENSAKGAGTLRPGQSPQDWGDLFDAEYFRWFREKHGQEAPHGSPMLENLRQAAKSGDEKAARLLRSAQTAPSEYAELKVSGPVPLTGDRWAGAILQPNDENIADLLRKRGLEVSHIGNIPSFKDDVFKVADEMQRAAGPVKERSLRVAAGWEPQQSPQFKIEGTPVPPKTTKTGTLGIDKAAFDSKEDAMKAAQMAAEGKANAKWLMANPGAFKQPAAGAQDLQNAALKATTEVPDMDMGTSFIHQGIHYSIDADGNVTKQGSNKVLMNLLEDVPQ